jgi:hypothetical protein
MESFCDVVDAEERRYATAEARIVCNKTEVRRCEEGEREEVIGIPEKDVSVDTVEYISWD